VISNLAVAFAPGFVPLVLARLVLGVGVGGFWGLSASLALRLVPAADLPMALSIIFGGGAVAGVAAAPLGTLSRRTDRLAGCLRRSRRAGCGGAGHAIPHRAADAGAPGHAVVGAVAPPADI
jgi:hypothetical protein